MITQLLLFSARLVIATLVVSAFFVVTQGIQIFPGILSGFFHSKSRLPEQLPQSVSSTFLQTSPKAKIELWKIPARQKSGRSKLSAVFFHGNAETIDSTLEFQLWLSALGLDVYAVEYRGFGYSSGWPSESAIYHDAQSVWNHLTAEHQIGAEEVIIIGRSIGCGPASYLASKISPRALILLAPYRSIAALVAEMPVFRLLKGFLWYQFPVEDFLAKLTETRVIVAHGVKDQIIPVQHSNFLVERVLLQTDHKLFISEKAGHNDLLNFIQSELAEEITNLLPLDNPLPSQPSTSRLLD